MLPAPTAKGTGIGPTITRARDDRDPALLDDRFHDKALAVPRFREMARGYDVVILDGPPRIGDVTRSAACAADVVVVPVQPGPFDLWAASETLELLDAADAIREELGRSKVRRLFVLNRAATGTVLAREAPGVLKQHGELAGVIHQRIAFPEASAVGESVLTVEPDGAASTEIRNLFRIIQRAA